MSFTFENPPFSLPFSPDVPDRAPQIGFHKGFSQGVEYRTYGPLKNILCGIKDPAGSVASGEKGRPGAKAQDESAISSLCNKVNCAARENTLGCNALR